MFHSSIKLIQPRNLVKIWHFRRPILVFSSIFAGIIGFESVTLADTAITNPKPNSRITCEEGSTRNNCIFSATVNMSNLPENSYISILLSAGGSIWWHSGNSIEYKGNDSEIIQDLTVNPQTTKTVRAFVIVTKNPLPQGKKYKSLPKYIEKSSTVNWKVPR
ncbi:hypothetical protein H6F32_04425 [Anabaena sp. FACHB-1237]|uniref:hypothetical protein n=1 Tax=Anabaena sp. FACHB-1237 TaxID=2692769 RepID=UPI0016817520|nr:hypothetical protein [Anabaena sp. FACHB-1237]MBD2136853.1 hypothetical protein [Anabaena sp. FACHB-1237]